MIYCDPSEIRSGSPIADIPDRFRKLLTPLSYLEAQTGADYLVTRSTLHTASAESVPGQLILKQMCADGILIQRKSGTDLANSIPGLKVILARMLDACPRCYLAPVGHFERGHDGKLLVDGRSTGWDYNAYLGAFESWSFHGGHVLSPFAASEVEFVERLVTLDKRLADSMTEALALTKPTEELAQHPKAPLIRTLLTFPGVGEALAVALVEWAPTGWECIMALTHFAMLKSDNKPGGLGKGTITKCREHLGIPEDTYGLGLYITPD